MRPFAHIFANLRKTAKNKLHNSTTRTVFVSFFRFFPIDVTYCQRVQLPPTCHWFRLKDSKALPWSYPQRSGAAGEDSESSGPPWRGADGLPWWCGYVHVPAWRWKIRGTNGWEKWNDNEKVVLFLFWLETCESCCGLFFVWEIVRVTVESFGVFEGWRTWELKHGVEGWCLNIFGHLSDWSFQDVVGTNLVDFCRYWPGVNARSLLCGTIVPARRGWIFVFICGKIVLMAGFFKNTSTVHVPSIPSPDFTMVYQSLWIGLPPCKSCVSCSVLKLSCWYIRWCDIGGSVLHPKGPGILGEAFTWSLWQPSVWAIESLTVSLW